MRFFGPLAAHKLLYSSSLSCANLDLYDEQMDNNCSSFVYLKNTYDNPNNHISKALEKQVKGSPDSSLREAT